MGRRRRRKGRGAWDSGRFVLRKRKGSVSRRERRALVGAARAAFHAPSICPNSGLDSGRRPSSLRRERADLPYLAGLD